MSCQRFHRLSYLWPTWGMLSGQKCFFLFQYCFWPWEKLAARMELPHNILLTHLCRSSLPSYSLSLSLSVSLSIRSVQTEQTVDVFLSEISSWSLCSGCSNIICCYRYVCTYVCVCGCINPCMYNIPSKSIIFVCLCLFRSWWSIPPTLEIRRTSAQLSMPWE